MNERESRQFERVSRASRPLVGRQRELEHLRNLLAYARVGNGGVVLVGGEAGVGKTRLCQELTDGVLTTGVRVAWGRQTEGLESRVCAPWFQILQELGESPVERSEPYFGGLTVSGLPSRDEEIRLLDSVSRSVLQYAKSETVLAILDDLHWSDTITIELFGQIARSASDSHLLLIATYRDADLDPNHALSRMLGVVRRERHVHHLPVRSLTVAETRELATSLAPNHDLLQWGEAIWRETTGNPFLAEELTRHLADLGALAAPPPRGPSGFDLRRLGLPEGIRQVVNLRTARLSDTARSVLTSACVSSGGFTFDTIQAMTGINDDSLLDAIDELLRAHLIVPQNDRQESYQFVHAIARESIYGDLNPSRRVRMHRKMAEALGALHGERVHEYAAELAIQYYASSTLTGSERGIEHALRAAQQAEDRAAREQAISFLNMALELIHDDTHGDRSIILRRLAVAYANDFDLVNTGKVIAQLRTSLKAEGVPESDLAPLLWEVAGALKDGGADEADWGAFVEQGLRIVDPADRLTWARLTLLKERFASVSSDEINAARWMGNDPEALEVARQGGTEDDFARTLQPFEVIEHETVEALVDRIMTWSRPTAIIRGLTVTGASWLYHLAEFRRARHHFQHLMAVSERYGSITGQTEAHIRLAIISCALGDLTDSQDHAATARELLTRLLPDHRLHTSLGWVDAYLAEYLGGDWRAIAHTLTDVVEDPRTGRRSIGLDDAALASLALARSGQSDAAMRMLTTLTGLLDRIETDTALANGAVALGASAAWALDAKGLAPRLFAAAVRLIEAGTRSFPCTSLELSAARMATLSQQHDLASRWFERARARLTVEGQRPLRAIVDLDEARALAKRGAGDNNRIETLLELARSNFQLLGMDEWAAFSYVSLPKGRKPELVVATERPGGLTRREVEVLRLVSQGQSDRQISNELYLSPRTVNAHIRNMLAKTESSNRTELSVWAMRNLFVDPGNR